MMQNTRVFVNNLQFNVSPSELRSFLDNRGLNPTEVFVPEDTSIRTRFKNRGFGFVEFETAEEAAEFIEDFNDQKGPSGRIMALSLAHTK